MFKLRIADAAGAVWDSLPDAARIELYEALFKAREDPWNETVSRSGDPKDVERLLILDHTVSALIIFDAPPVQRLRLISIDDLD